MGGGEYARLTCCDRDCARANHCTQGGVRCPCCGMWFCPVCEYFDERGYCEDCAEEYPGDDGEEQEQEGGEKDEDEDEDRN